VGTQTYSDVHEAHDIYNAQYNFNPASAGIGDIGNGNTYKVTENISAGYVQAKFMLTKKLQVLGGVRAEFTDDQYTTALPLTTPKGVNGHIWYSDILPSLHLKYSLTDNQNLRVSYFRSISRPGFHEFTPYLLPNPEFFDEQGNPFIKHTTADNYDMRYELFPGGADQVLAGVFYKRIYDPIETGFTRTPTTGGNSIPGSLYLTPLNFGNATNYGAEFVVTKYFGKIGINANYTYTHSAITTERNYLYYNTATGRPDNKTLSQTRPLQGQAKHIGNLSLLLKAPKLGLDAQLAFVYTGERIIQVSQYYGLDSWQKPFSQLDFSFEEKIVKHFSVFAKVNNLTNSKTKVVIKQPNILDKTLNKITGQENADEIFIQRDIYKLNFLFGLRYKL
jgi:TonB-dependent receptor